MDCLFCKIVNKEIPSRIITETDNSIAFLDAFPVSCGHTLVIPKNHYEKVQDMTDNDNNDLFDTVHKVGSKVDKLTGLHYWQYIMERIVVKKFRTFMFI